MNRLKRVKLQDVLLERGLLTKERLDEALAVHRKEGGSLSKILVERGYIDEAALQESLAHALSVPPIDLQKYSLDEDTVHLIPESLARRYGIIALSKLGTTLTVAMADPLNVIAIDDLRMQTGLNIEPTVARASDVEKLITKYYSDSGESDALMAEIERSGEAADEAVEMLGNSDEASESAFDLGEDEAEEAPAVKLVNTILMESIRRRASDIHIEPYEDGLRVRYRVDGGLAEVARPPKRLQPPLTARLKIMSGMDIAERRVPQDGRFKVRFVGKELDYRVSSVPVTFGEKIVMRALDKSSLLVDLEGLGYDPASLEAFNHGISTAWGMILVTGPTGSGKSTTLYSVLSLFNRPDRNIITIEDPVEYQVDGITQIQVNPDIGLTFARTLRAILRQNPDIVMVGEIRDFETADIAVKAALTGQIVFSTLHTNSAAGAVTRLTDMGVEPFLISSAVVMSVGQRLVRRLCDSCKAPKELLEVEAQELGMETRVVYEPVGCAACNGRGYKGRTAIGEVLLVDDEIRELVTGGADTDEIQEAAVKKGMLTLRRAALKKVERGETSLAEVIRVTAEDT